MKHYAFTLLLILSSTLLHFSLADDLSTVDSSSTSAPLIGGLKAIAVNNSLLLEAITAVRPQMAVHLSALSPYAHRLGPVTEAYSQVVAGLKFYAGLQLAQTDCLRANVSSTGSTTPTGALLEETSLVMVGDQPNNSNNSSSNCTTTHSRTCQAEIWVQSWLNSNELLAFTCSEPSALSSTSSSPVPSQ